MRQETKHRRWRLAEHPANEIWNCRRERPGFRIAARGLNAQFGACDQAADYGANWRQAGREEEIGMQTAAKQPRNEIGRICQFQPDRPPINNPATGERRSALSLPTKNQHPMQRLWEFEVRISASWFRFRKASMGRRRGYQKRCANRPKSSPLGQEARESQ